MQSFGEFEAVGSCAAGPCYWRMRDGKGNVYYFGGDEANNAGRSGTFQAALWEPDHGTIQRRGIVTFALYKIDWIDGLS